ncbi:helix-turn-helix domain-containing protein [Stackebrandtia nassauensis]|uniref:Transcriptional regulator, XRE family n=1 Tax=Stackebrandtia nassauensis (strain DSM 44728 / CIP 108903 / NRRL B-16338 / NBRC 102104 / LLR-40K-21) TaxID=446470 RepID=D3Q2G1_STANL|nr:helix-turn-helix domain-containing protein [Stackebrandtia nassauensis]ADD43894.1 transcriptional regulator, XRE family [Stackebrandtia nassauensis DSM 44728]
MADTTPGKVIRGGRQRRRMTQAALAESAGVSIDLVRKLEQGQRNSARIDSLMAIANALDMPVGDLIGKPRGLTVGAENGEVLHLRRAILGITPHSGEPPSLADLRAQLGELWDMYWHGRYAVLARSLPGHITAARALAHSASGTVARHAHTGIAEALQLTASLLTHLAHEDLAQLALTHATAAADAADDPLLVASMQATRTWVLTRQGLWSEAETIAATTADEVEPKLSTGTVDQLAVWGELLRYTALSLTRAGRHTEATDAQQLLDAAAARMGSDRASKYTGIAFGPTVAAMRAVDAAVAADKPRHALDLARRVTTPDAVPPAMHARYLLTVAYAQTLDWRNTDAVNTIRHAESITPELLPHQTLARVLVAELLPRRRTQRLPGLVPLAQRIGVTG